jgi:hypothetical protein
VQIEPSNIHLVETSHDSKLHVVSHIGVLRPTQSSPEIQQQKVMIGSNKKMYIRLSCTCVLNHFRTDSKSKRNCMDPIEDSS